MLFGCCFAAGVEAADFAEKKRFQPLLFTFEINVLTFK